MLSVRWSVRDCPQISLGLVLSRTVGWSDKAAQPSGTILPPPPSYRRRTAPEEASWAPGHLSGDSYPYSEGPTTTIRHLSPPIRHTPHTPSGRRVIERGVAPPRRRRSSSPLEREPLNFLPSGSGWFGAAQISERNVALGCPRLLLPTSGKDDDTEPVGGTAPQSLWTMLQRQLIPPPLIGFLSCSGQRSLGSGPNEPSGWEAPHGWVDVSPEGCRMYQRGSAGLPSPQ